MGGRDLQVKSRLNLMKINSLDENDRSYKVEIDVKDNKVLNIDYWIQAYTNIDQPGLISALLPPPDGLPSIQPSRSLGVVQIFDSLEIYTHYDAGLDKSLTLVDILTKVVATSPRIQQLMIKFLGTTTTPSSATFTLDYPSNKYNNNNNVLALPAVEADQDVNMEDVNVEEEKGPNKIEISGMNSLTTIDKHYGSSFPKSLNYQNQHCPT